ncbi:helix-turn-helix domain-containing protein [Candidatus Omnitrophota bacterium]
MLKTENQNIEFKENWRDDVLKTLSAFANTEGGIVYIGINDKGKSIEVKNIKKLLEDIPNKIKDMLGIVADVKSTKKDKHTIIKITINKYKAPIAYKGKYYMRSGSTTLLLDDHSLSHFLLSSSGTRWESVVEPNSSIKDIKVKTVRYFQDLAKKQYPFIAKEKDVSAVLQKLGLMEGDKLNRAAILLFGKDTKRYFTSAYIQVGRFISDSEVISTDIIEGNLFEQLENTIQVLRIKYLENQFYYEGLYRKEDMIYPEEALREAVINSLIHRDYIGP